MCGIVGAIGFVDNFISEKIHLMNELQKHRGPDGEGIWKHKTGQKNQGVIFGHRRLAIIDLSQDGHQPMMDIVSGNSITFNGEIYNYRSLRDELVAQGESFKTKTDTEVILVAYRHWGENFVEKLRGMFAFALWDSAKDEVIFCRDRLGIKPLYYYEKQEQHRTLLFSSELRTLLKSDLVPRKLNPEGMQSYLWNGYVASKESTIIKDIKILPPGFSMRVSVSSGEIISKYKFWSLPKRYSSPQSTVSSVSKVFEETMQLHMLSDVSLGVFLSGGVDSSAVAAVAKSQADTQVSTYNLSFDETLYDEAKYARQVAKSLGTDHHEIKLTQSDFNENFTASFESIDQPTFDGINTFFISKAIKDAGITVALAGTGGDELFGGYSSFREVPKITRVGNIINHVPECLANLTAGAWNKIMELKYGAVPPQTRWGKLADLIRVKGNTIGAYQTTYSLFTSEFQNKLSGQKSENIKFGVDKALYATLSEDIVNCSTLESISNLELNMFIEQRLMRDTDAASMATSLEVRVPLLDHVFIESVAGLSPETRYQPLGKKQVLRDLAARYINPDIFERPKSGFVLPLDIWCKNSMQKEISDLFNNNDLCLSIGLNPSSVQNLLSAFNNNQTGIYWTRIWGIYILLAWCKNNQVSLH